jgi:hypothetical protein
VDSSHWNPEEAKRISESLGNWLHAWFNSNGGYGNHSHEQLWHILVAVLDPMLLPPKLDVVIGDHYFELKFEVEPVGFDDKGDEVHFNFENGNNDGNPNMEVDEDNDGRNMDRDRKRTRRDKADGQN